jgi:hypothetical protein
LEGAAGALATRLADAINGDNTLKTPGVEKETQTAVAVRCKRSCQRAIQVDIHVLARCETREEQPLGTSCV